MFAGLIMFLSIFNCESPRYLIKNGQDCRAISNLSRLRRLAPDSQYLTSEIQEIQNQLVEEKHATSGMIGELLVPSNIYRVSLGVGTQLLGQWSGAQSITVYAPQFFGILGLQSETKLLATAVMGVVKFMAALICALFLIDTIGRKRSLTIGITLQGIALIYVAAFLTAVPQITHRVPITAQAKNASIGAILMIYVCGIGWAMGWNSVQYLLNAEMYPLRIRALCSSAVMFLHFVNQYGSNKAVPLMLLKMRPAGTFWFFSGVTVVGGLWAWFFIPETASRSLESMDRLFQLPWYNIGRMGQREAEEEERHEQESEQKASDMRGFP
jgi:Sugar (and other) transporter